MIAIVLQLIVLIHIFLYYSCIIALSTYVCGLVLLAALSGVFGSLGLVVKHIWLVLPGVENDS